MSSLYNISNDLRNIFFAIETNDGEVTPELDAALTIGKAELESKAVSYALAVRELTGRGDVIKAEMERLNKLKKQADNFAERLKNKISDAMQEFGVEKVEGDLIKLSFRKSDSVEIIDLNDVPQEYTRVIPETIEADKTAIKKALKDGIDVPGARLDAKKNLQIK